MFGDTYWTTFAPVVSWTTVRCVFILALLLGWHMRSIDFVMAYTQADVKTDIFMQLPSGTTIQGVDPNKHLLKLQKNLYGLKDGQVTWHKHEDSVSPKWTPAFLLRGLFFSSSMLTMPPSFHPTPLQSTVRSCPSSNVLTSLMKVTSKTTWGQDSPSTLP